MMDVSGIVRFLLMLPVQKRDLFQLKTTLDDLYSIDIELPSVFLRGVFGTKPSIKCSSFQGPSTVLA